MITQAHRTGQERRQAPRLRVNLKTYWETTSERHEGVVLDLSRKGCFIVTPLATAAGPDIKVEVGLPGVLHMTLEGTIVHRSKGRGLGVRFKGMTPTQQVLLLKLIRSIVHDRLE